MTDDLPPMPDESTAPPADPFEAELVAYLDGELEPPAARKIEARLASDPAARAKATALKKTFELLDYLPKREPSATFATRTLEQLPAMKSGARAAQPAAQPQPMANPTVPAPGSASASVSSSVPIALSSGMMSFAPPTPNRWGLWAAGVLIAVSACAAAGYFASGAIHPYLFPVTPPREVPPPDELQIADHHIVENLPLYAAADDLDFVHELANPEFFGDHPAVSFDPALKPPAVDPDKPSGPGFEKLATAFKALPSVRQQAIRDLDKQLRGLDVPTRDQRFRVLEVYTVWLDRLPESDRRQVFIADTPRRRLDEIRKVRNQQWLDALPPAQRAKLKELPAAQQAELIRQWKDEDLVRREEWSFARAHAEDIAANKIPWPFDSADRRKDVIEFMRVTYRTDDDKRCRFAESERTRYNSALTLANEKGGWMMWWGYGKVTYELARKYEVLPEPATTEPITTYAQLGVGVERWFLKGKGRTATLAHVGKWPEFALAVHNYAGTEKSDKIPLPALGPAKPGEFKEPLRRFVTNVLVPKLPPADRKTLEGLEGKWPEYPREMVRLAKQQDLVAPGVMLPESPKQWDRMYTFGPRIKP